MSKLVIVESPTKAKTISKFLGKEYKVLSSFGHVRDLPKSTMGVDPAKDFKAKYVIPTKQRKNVNELKKAAEKADEILFATDEDREGEAISWHLSEILGVPEKKIKRIVFHEITKHAIEEALKNPRPIDIKLVDAQQARRILDRLVGYELSPFLWHKVRRGLSAGRVQSVAVRLIVDREREREAFKSEEYWTIEALMSKDRKEFESKLHAIENVKLEKLEITNQDDAEAIVNDLKDAEYKVSKVTKKEKKRSVPTPFTTSKLQQEANTKLGFSAKKTMMIAQQLYEGVEIAGEGSVGLITYMRTDSLNLSDKFRTDAKEFLLKELGTDFHEEQTYKTKSKGAQEAHEAIRPTEASREPISIKSDLSADQFKLYDLIWRRSMASQMPAAIFDATTVDIESGRYSFRASGQIIKFEGFLKMYLEKQKETILPELVEGDAVELVKLDPNQHFTEPPARYTDASLVKALEEHEIGRPSTYAPTIHTIIDRGYVERDEKKHLFPTTIAGTVTDMLVEHFPDIVDLKFTANMEDNLDSVAIGKVEWVPLLNTFYGPFHENLEKKEKEVEKVKPKDVETDIVCEKCGKPMVIKDGRFGKFLACTGFPDCKNTKQIKNTGEEGEVEVEVEETDEVCEKCGAPMMVKHGRYGKFLSCTKYPDCKTIKSIEKGTGVKCPKCGKGEMIEKRTRRGKTFYGCNKYPDCDNAVWSKPTGELCPECKSLLVYGAKDTIRCGSKECKYKTKAPAAPPAEGEAGSRQADDGGKE
ncbi:type I DNA topoisomerase [Patescibacteria group bacterium]|nr:type I DNA topoisomerase [Patescibacteria group bacterium]MBU1907367.1 type I DNA topoisomerase [Patescibacteria group bacterium]